MLIQPYQLLKSYLLIHYNNPDTGLKQFFLDPETSADGVSIVDDIVNTNRKSTVKEIRIELLNLVRTGGELSLRDDQINALPDKLKEIYNKVLQENKEHTEGGREGEKEGEKEGGRVMYYSEKELVVREVHSLAIICGELDKEITKSLRYYNRKNKYENIEPFTLEEIKNIKPQEIVQYYLLLDYHGSKKGLFKEFSRKGVITDLIKKHRKLELTDLRNLLCDYIYLYAPVAIEEDKLPPFVKAAYDTIDKDEISKVLSLVHVSVVLTGGYDKMLKDCYEKIY